MSKKVLILGVNGFIGSHLTDAILKQTDWEVYGMDMSSNKLGNLVDNPRFHFLEGDITINKEWIEYHVKKCDVCLPLVAIATPSTYVNDPLRVFELDFEANLNIIRLCVRYGTRVVFPSTSEVYGMSAESEFDEETTNLVLGPIQKQRWIYSCSKQLLDRVIFAYGQKEKLSFTLFRPFNWYGPKLDDVFEQKEGSSRVLTQFISNIIHGKELQLVAGGLQRRSFTYIDDGIAALLKIIQNKDDCANGQIFNIGNPKNDMSIAQLADILLAEIQTYPQFAEKAKQTKVNIVQPESYYGKGYQDVSARVPAIENAKKHLDWEPQVDFVTGLRRTLDYYVTEMK
jgi:nucleoside-diphosphate-sugar epimerase